MTGSEQTEKKRGWFGFLRGRKSEDAPEQPEAAAAPEPAPPEPAPPRLAPGEPAPLPTPEPQLEPAEIAEAAPAAEASPRWFGFLRGRKAEEAPDRPEPAPPEAPPGPDVQPEPELPPGVPPDAPQPELPPDIEPEPDLPEPPEVPPEISPPMEPWAEKPKVEGGWFARLRSGLAKSSSRLTRGLADLFTKRKLDDEALEELEELLITADLGVATAARVTRRLAKSRFGKEVDAEEIKAALAEEIGTILDPVALPLTIDAGRKPFVILVVGVNGSGKTTTIGKLAKQYKEAGLSVTLAAGDTFRAAAVEQLKVWGQRSDCPVISRDTGADAAGLAFDALAEARRRGDDVLMIDTAGRLQNKSGLMAELQKVLRVIKKQDETAPHAVLLVLDATVGQNAHSQVEVFREMCEVTGLVVTKLDGTARGGVVVALAEKFGLPVHAIGVGESADDLRPFSAQSFARSLVGLG